MCLSILLACMSMWQLSAWCSRKSEEGIWSPETSVMDGYELYVGAGNQTQASFKPNTETLIGEGTIFRRDCLASFNYQLDII